MGSRVSFYQAPRSLHESTSLPPPEVLALHFEPVTLEHDRDHAFVKRQARGCGTCGKAKIAVEHHGYPQSLNALGDGNRFAYRAMKIAWETRLLALLEQSELPRPLARVVAEGELTVPDRTRRDQGNHRFMLEKALGDALVTGGWIPDDDWSRFEFGGLQAVYLKGVSRMRLMIFPAAIELQEQAS
jgi:hypothetical protein